MIHVDTPVVLAQLLAEDRIPDAALWRSGSLVTSRLPSTKPGHGSTPETWARVMGKTSVPCWLVSPISSSCPPVLTRALEPFPAPVRTHDALHLASIEFLRGMGQRPELATFDRRMAEAAEALGSPVAAA